MNHWNFLVAFFVSHPWLQNWHSWHQLRAEAIHAYPHLKWLRHWSHWQALLAYLRLAAGHGA